MKLKIKTSRDFDLEQKEEPLFAKTKGGSGTFVFKHGRLWHKHEVNNVEDIDSKRSDLAAPMVMRDIPEYRNMVDGKPITSRSWHREFLKKNNLVELGNEGTAMQKTYKPAKGEVAREIKETIEQLKAGYVNPEEGVMPDGYVEEPDEDLDPISVSDDVQTGDYIRETVEKE